MLAYGYWGSAATIAQSIIPYHWFDSSSSAWLREALRSYCHGYTLVYGVLRMINFAHSEVFMSGLHCVLVAAAFTHPVF